MHIADGYLSPTTVIVSYAIAVPLWMYGFKKLKEKLTEETLPILGALTALSFIIMMFNVPAPGGTSGHAVGSALIAILFGPWVGFVSVSLVLLIQALVFGDGGISAWAINSLSMGFVESFVAYYVFQLLKNFKFAPFVAGYIGIVSASLVVGVVLGIQPLFWHTSDGKPLYFPFPLSVSVPAMVGVHALVFGFVEGIFTQIIYSFLKKDEKVVA